jgi:predicted oxidoreductase
VANSTPAQFALLQESVPFPLAAIQIELSVLTSHALTDGTLADAQRRRIASMFWSPLGGGRLFKDEAHAALRAVLTRIGRAYDVGAAAIAIAWLLRLPGGSVPVLGSSDPGRIDELAKARGIVLDRQDWYEIYAASGQNFA